MNRHLLNSVLKRIPHQSGHLTGVGAAATCWAYVEWMVRFSLWDLARMKPAEALVMTNNMNFKVALNAVRAFISLDFDKETQDRFGDIAESLNRLEATRNTAVHTFWQRTTSAELLKPLDFKHGKNNRILQTKVSSDDLLLAGTEILAEGDKYKKLMDELGVATLPRKPKKRGARSKARRLPNRRGEFPPPKLRKPASRRRSSQA